MEEKEKRKKVLEYQILQSRLNTLAKEREEIAQRIVEISQTMSSLDGLKKDDEIILSIGSGVFIKSKPVDDKFLVEIGSSMLLEKNKEEAKKILEKRKDDLEKALEQVENEIRKIGKEIELIAMEVSGQNVQSS